MLCKSEHTRLWKKQEEIGSYREAEAENNSLTGAALVNELELVGKSGSLVRPVDAGARERELM